MLRSNGSYDGTYYIFDVDLDIYAEQWTDASVRSIAYSVDGSCDWEVEHGLQIVVRDDEILYVGNYEGVSIWDEKDNYIDEWRRHDIRSSY